MQTWISYGWYEVSSNLCPSTATSIPSPPRISTHSPADLVLHHKVRGWVNQVSRQPPPRPLQQHSNNAWLIQHNNTTYPRARFVPCKIKSYASSSTSPDSSTVRPPKALPLIQASPPKALSPQPNRNRKIRSDQPTLPGS
jgi:hypothetical protein